VAVFGCILGGVFFRGQCRVIHPVAVQPRYLETNESLISLSDGHFSFCRRPGPSAPVWLAFDPHRKILTYYISKCLPQYFPSFQPIQGWQGQPAIRRHPDSLRPEAGGAKDLVSAGVYDLKKRPLPLVDRPATSAKKPQQQENTPD
jgi:hypothetical protein